MRIMRFLAAAGLALASSIPASAQTAVDVELSLLLDVSGSVDATEFDLQRQGYVSAFNSTTIQNAILSGPIGAIAVNYIHWSGAAQQQELIGWTLINSVATAQAFATSIAGFSRAFDGSPTAIGSAIDFATPLFFSNSFSGTRRIMDISGDGCWNDGTDPETARANALGAGISTINGITIGDGEGCGLVDHYVHSVTGGSGAFVMVAATFEDFAPPLEAKLGGEITGTTPEGAISSAPEPLSMLLLGTGLFGVGAARRRRAQDVVA